MRAEREVERLNDAQQFAEKQRRDAAESARASEKAAAEAVKAREAVELQIRMHAATTSTN